MTEKTKNDPEEEENLRCKNVCLPKNNYHVLTFQITDPFDPCYKLKNVRIIPPSDLDAYTHTLFRRSDYIDVSASSVELKRYKKRGGEFKDSVLLSNPDTAPNLVIL